MGKTLWGEGETNLIMGKEHDKVMSEYEYWDMWVSC